MSVRIVHQFIVKDGIRWCLPKQSSPHFSITSSFNRIGRKNAIEHLNNRTYAAHWRNYAFGVLLIYAQVPEFSKRIDIVPKYGYNTIVSYEVMVSRKALKSIRKMPAMEKMRFDQLTEDLRTSGPVQKEWPNYSKLSQDEHHCHLSYKWVACWRHHRGEIRIEVYYAGPRENAPY